MKYFLLAGILIGILHSCKEETSYRLQILIENKTDSKLMVKLFPKTIYKHGDLYIYSELGNGDYADMDFEVEPEDNRSLFISTNLDIEPHFLTSMIFDSISIKLFDENKTEMKFSNDTVIGYSENLYDNKSVWIYKKNNYDEPDSFNSNPVESFDYSFLISKEKY